METSKIENTLALKSVEIIGFAPGRLVIRPIYKQSTGHISIVCIDKGKSIDPITCPFNTFYMSLKGVPNYSLIRQEPDANR